MPILVFAIRQTQQFANFDEKAGAQMHNKNLDNHLFTKKELIAWLNDLLQIQVNCIEELGNGAAFCQLVDIISRGAVRMQKINWNAKLQHQNLANIKILSTSMLAAGIDKKFDVVRISQKKTQDILELLQWFRKYFLQNNLSIETYDPTVRRRSQSTDKNMLEVRSSVEKNKKPKTLNFIKPQLSAKRQPESIITDSQLKNCFKVNKAIEKIVCQQPETPAETKIELIKKIIFKKSQVTNSVETVEPQQAYNHLNSISSGKTIPDRENVKSYTQNKVKIETCPIYNPYVMQDCMSHDSPTSITQKSTGINQAEAREQQSHLGKERKFHKSQKSGRN